MNYPPNQPLVPPPDLGNTDYLPPPVPGDDPYLATDPSLAATPDQPPPPPFPIVDAGQPRRRWPLLIAALLAIVAIVAALGFVIARGVGGSTAATPGAVLAARNYCADLQKQNYTAAYGLFGAQLQTALPAVGYAPAAKLLDTQFGTATACAPATTATLSSDGQTATVAVAVTRQHLAQATDVLAFAHTGTAWTLSQAPDTALLPIATGAEFCQALIASNPVAAYALLSTSFQQAVGSAAQFASSLQQLEQLTGSVTACTLQHWALNTNGHAGVVSSGTSFTNISNVPTQVNVTEDATGAWKVDSIVISVAGTPLQLPINLGG